MKWKKNLAIKKISGLLLASLLLAQSALAASKLLNSVELEQPDGKLKAEIWGETLPGGYNKDLLLMLKDKDDKLISAYTPDVRGGYNPYLQTVKLRGADKERQLLLAVGEGDWRAPTSYRIYDVRKADAIKEIFTAEENLGVVDDAHLEGDKLKLKLQSGKDVDVELDEKVIPEKIRGNGQLDYQKLHSLSVYDGNHDGIDVLIMNQQIRAGKNLLADVSAIYYYQEQEEDKEPAAEKDKLEQLLGKKDPKQPVYWNVSNYAIMSNSITEKATTINDGYEFSKAIILPRRMVLVNKEATYPLVVCPGKSEKAEKINKLLREESKDYYTSFFHRENDVAFNVLNGDRKLLSIQFICGNGPYDHHQVNIDPETGEKIELKDILDVKHPDLLPLLDLLKTNDLMEFKEIPQEWYIAKDRLYLLQKIGGEDCASSYSLEDLHKFIINKKWSE